MFALLYETVLQEHAHSTFSTRLLKSKQLLYVINFILPQDTKTFVSKLLKWYEIFDLPHTEKNICNAIYLKT